MRRRPYLSFHGLLTHHCLICIQIPPLSISLTRLEEPVRTIRSLPPAYRCIQVGESTKAKMIECSGHVEPALRMGGCKVQQLTVELAVFGIGTLLSVRSFSSLLAFPLITLGVTWGAKCRLRIPAQTSIWLSSVFVGLPRRPISNFLPPHQPQAPSFPVQDPHRPFHPAHYRSLQEGLQPCRLEVE